MIEFLSSIGHLLVGAFTVFTVTVSSVIPNSTIILSPTPTPTPPIIKFIEAYGEYRYQGYEEKIYFKIPENGGNVEGYVKGDCKGNINGSYDGQTKLEGTLGGECDVIAVFHVTGEWSGTINKSEGKILINYQGSGGGFEKSGELTMTFTPIQ